MSHDLDNARLGAPDCLIDEECFRQRFYTRPWMITYKGSGPIPVENCLAFLPVSVS